jgi:polyvinyl alcohol dehydrogenase (cytochrome)
MRSVLFAVALLLVSAVASAQPPSGEAVYKQYCAGCHDGSLPRMPSRESLRGVTPEAIETALSSFTMRRQGAALSGAERRAVAEFLSGRPAGSYKAPLDTIAKSAYCAADPDGGSSPLAGPSWNGWGVDLRNSRFQSAAAAGLTPADVPRLMLKWAFGLPGVAASGSQISVSGRRAFVGSRNGVVYSLDTRSGCLAWAFEADAGVRSTPILAWNADGTPAGLYFGDSHAQAYALDPLTGALRWKIKLEDHPDAIITGAIAAFAGRLYVPMSSLEEGTGMLATYQCCTFRGSLTALDAATGRRLWKTYTIPDAAKPTTKNARGTQLWGPSGGSVWSSPALDPDRNRLYVATGDSYSNPAAPETDAILALAMDSGRVAWVRQTLAGDAWNVGCLETSGPGRANCPDQAGPDHDFSSSPVLSVYPDGRRVLLAGQKSGAMYGVNPESGELLWKAQAGEGGVLGGIEWGFATDGDVAYASLSGALEKKAGEAGGLVALGVLDGKARWRVPPAADTCGGRAGCNTGQPAAVTAIPGVVFSGSLDGHFRAYMAGTGRVLWDVDTARPFETVNGVPAHGGSLNGPGATVVGGMVFVTSGYSSLGFMPGNVLLAFSVDGR